MFSFTLRVPLMSHVGLRASEFFAKSSTCRRDAAKEKVRLIFVNDNEHVMIYSTLSHVFAFRSNEWRDMSLLPLQFACKS